jgi:pantetheine-phosphate adenylyltransferase
MNERVAVYPGSFDPPTLGHVALITKASALFDKLYVMIGVNPDKPNFFFHPTSRQKFLEEIVKDLGNVEVKIFPGATILFCNQNNVEYIVRSFRSVTDFEYERQIANVNLKLNPKIQTLFMHLSDGETGYISSSTAREIYKLGLLYSLKDFVPENVCEAMIERYHTTP